MAADAEPSSEPLKYQTSILKVSIHCEGCKRKIRKLLQGIDGVYEIKIDSQQQKVTVTGNVQADALIKKLLKTGKHAELWPEKNPSDPSLATGAAAGGGKKNKKKGDASGGPTLDSPVKITPGGEDVNGSSSENKTSYSNEPTGMGGGDAPKSASTPQEKIAGEVGGAVSSPGSVKKKGKKKSRVAAQPTDGNQRNGSLLAPNSHFPAFPTQSPAYILSYSTPQPTAGYSGVAHHQAGLHQSGYLYFGNHLANGTYYIPSLTSTQASFDLFSEENANACTVM